MTGREAATVASAVGSGLAAGVLFGFSSFVMPALRRVPAAQGIAVMQSINRQAVTAPFMIVLFGTAAASIGVGTQAALHRHEPYAAWAGIGTVSYLMAIAITAAYHVPRNDRLATFDAGTAEAARYWSTYVGQWTTANHVRTAAAAVAATAFTMAVRSAR